MRRRLWRVRVAAPRLWEKPQKPPINHPELRAWSFLGGVWVVKKPPRAAPMSCAPGRFWVVLRAEKPPRPPAPAWPGARSSRCLAVFVCGYKQPRPPSAQLVRAPGDQVVARCTWSKGICAAWSRVYGQSMSARICEYAGREYVSMCWEYAGYYLLPWPRPGEGGPSDGARANAGAANNFLYGRTLHPNVLRFAA